jgi:hypothetical protein
VSSKVFLAIFLLFAILSGALVEITSAQIANAVEASDSEPITPLQLSIQKALDDMSQDTVSSPSVKYQSTSKIEDNSGLTAQSQEEGVSDRVLTVDAVTTLSFENPQQAGLLEWQPIQPADANITQFLLENYPDIYSADAAQLGKEPREITITEKLKVTELRKPMQLSTNAFRATSTGDVVMGFSIDRFYEYTRTETLQGCFRGNCIELASASIGFKAGFAIGLRLPATVDIESPDSLEAGNEYFYTAGLIPLDYDADDYRALGIPALNGHELEAKGGLKLTIDVSVIALPAIHIERGKILDIGDLCREQHNIDCQNFVTPFGFDENGDAREFPIPSLVVEPEDSGLMFDFIVSPIPFIDVSGWIGVGLRVDPDFTSDNVSADWSSSGDASGNGKITFTGVNPSVDFGPVVASNIQTEGTATITLDNFEYHLDTMILEFGANLQSEGKACLLFFLCKPYFVDTDYVTLFEFNLAELTGELVIPQHKGTEGVATVTPVVGKIPPDDKLFCGKDFKEFTIVGTSGNDDLLGTSGDDAILGGNGDDRITGFGGDDFICGGAGDDTLLGGLGDDNISGGSGDDIISAGAGDDEIEGGSGWDELNGGRGKDSVYGGNGNDSLTGGWGNDLLDGNDGGDKIDGGKDEDACLNGEQLDHCE